MDCPSAEILDRWVAGQLPPPHQAWVENHAGTCRLCNAVVVARRNAAQTPGAPASGTIVGGRFRIDQLLGAGGMGYVVAATHLELGNRVALKFMRADLIASPSIVERFIREARAVVKLRTEHVCKVLDVARGDDGAPYIVMELLEGADLGRAISHQPLPVALAVDYILQACIALAEAHGNGVIHRDLKPANLFVTRRVDGGPLVKVLDFGIAKAIFEGDASLTRTRISMGSPGFMSPEQLESARDVDARADVWALGVTLYQLVSGRLPFWAPTTTEIAIQVTCKPPAPIDVDPRLRDVLFRCLDKDRARRYPNVAELAHDLVPFGGPGASHLATAVRTVASSTGTELVTAPPMVSVTAPTAVSMDRRPIAPPVPPPPSKRWIVVSAIAALVGVAAAVIAVVASGSTPEHAARSADAAVVAAIAVDAITVDAGVEAGVDAGIDAGIDAAIDEATAPLAPAAPLAPDAASEAPDELGDLGLDLKGLGKQISGAKGAMKEGCQDLIKHPEQLEMMPPMSVALCWCALGDRPRALAVINKLSPTNRSTMRLACQQVGGMKL